MWIRVEVKNRFVAVRNWEMIRIQFPHDLENIKCQQSGLVRHLCIGILHVLPLLALWVIQTQYTSHTSHASAYITSFPRRRYATGWNVKVRGGFTQVREEMWPMVNVPGHFRWCSDYVIVISIHSKLVRGLISVALLPRLLTLLSFSGVGIRVQSSRWVLSLVKC